MVRMGCVLVSILVLGACRSSEECERTRQQAHRAYQALKQEAVQRKLAGVATETWMEVENKTELLESAFATQQVTWRSAEKTREVIEAKLPDLQTDNPVHLEIFRRSAEEAFKLQDMLFQQCR